MVFALEVEGEVQSWAEEDGRCQCPGLEFSLFSLTPSGCSCWAACAGRGEGVFHGQRCHPGPCSSCLDLPLHHSYSLLQLQTCWKLWTCSGTEKIIKFYETKPFTETPGMIYPHCLDSYMQCLACVSLSTGLIFMRKMGLDSILIYEL